MSIPTSEKATYNPRVTRGELIKSLPVDKWVTAKDAPSLSVDAFKQAMRTMPPAFVDRKKDGCSLKYRVRSRSYAALMEHLTPQKEKPKKQKIVPRKMTTGDELHNLFEWA